MADGIQLAEADRRRIIDRANRMLKQSQTLRKLADELLDESRDIRQSARHRTPRTVSERRKKG